MPDRYVPEATLLALLNSTPVLLGATGQGSANGLYTWPLGRTNAANRANNQQIWHPFTFDKAATVKVGLDVVTAGAAGAIERVGFYADGVHNQPGAVLDELDPLSVASTGLKITTETFAVVPGVRYWLSFKHETPGTVAAFGYFINNAGGGNGPMVANGLLNGNIGVRTARSLSGARIPGVAAFSGPGFGVAPVFQPQ